MTAIVELTEAERKLMWAKCQTCGGTGNSPPDAARVGEVLRCLTCARTGLRWPTLSRDIDNRTRRIPKSHAERLEAMLDIVEKLGSLTIYFIPKAGYRVRIAYQWEGESSNRCEALALAILAREA